MSLAEQQPAPRAIAGSPGLSQFIVDLCGYGAASALALALDYGLLVTLTYRFAVPYLIASTIGFSSGLCLAYGLSVAFVFKGRRRLPAREELLGFAAIGLAGLVLTQILLAGLVEIAHLPVALAKPIVAGAVFMFNFAMRRDLLFARKICVGSDCED